MGTVSKEAILKVLSPQTAPNVSGFFESLGRVTTLRLDARLDACTCKTTEHRMVGGPPPKLKLI